MFLKFSPCFLNCAMFFFFSQYISVGIAMYIGIATLILPSFSHFISCEIWKRANVSFFRYMPHYYGIIFGIKSPDEVHPHKCTLTNTHAHKHKHTHTLQHTTTSHTAAVGDLLSRPPHPPHPTWFSLTHKVAVCGGDISKTVSNVGMHLRMKRFPTLGHGSTCMLQLVKRLMRCFHRVISHWCAERSGEAEPHVWELDGRTDEETEGGSECTLSGCREKLFFFPALFPLGTQAKCMRSCLKCIGALTSKSAQRRPHAYCRRYGAFYQVEQWRTGPERTHVHMKQRVLLK